MLFTDIFFILAGGIVPALFWLWYWLKEDRLHPEPRRLIILTFFAGMLVVGLALPLEHAIDYVLASLGLINAYEGLLLLFLWALAEEYSKYLAAKKTSLAQKEFDEPVDALIYLITAALGFAALENVFFLAGTISDFGILEGIRVGNLRFAGSTLLHILSSSMVGGALAFSFYKPEKRKRYVFVGLILATVLHTLFNFFVMRVDSDQIFSVFIPLWFLVIVLLLVFEKVKRIRR